MVSPEPGVPAPASNAHSYTVPAHLLPAAAQLRAMQEGLVDVQFLCAPKPEDLHPPDHHSARFMTPLGLCVILYCIAIAALVGYAQPFMKMRVGPVNGACVFAFSQLLIAWAVAALYVRAAGIFALIEPDAAPVREEARGR
jgi:uncharacterized membrane protein (DUF485 family)